MDRTLMSTTDLEPRGHCTALGTNSTLEATAVQLSEDIAELRRDGRLPEQTRTVITILPLQRLLQIRVEDLSIEDDPDHTTVREVIFALFELASYHNIAPLDGNTPPEFTVQILVVGPDGRPVTALIGTAVGDVETRPQPAQA